MSKKFWLPPQKGTEIYPVVGQTPIRLIVKGVPPGSPQEAQLVEAHQGILSQFIAKQRHAYSLSTIPIHKGRIDRDGVTMTYVNQQGMETATLEVRSTSSASSSKTTKSRRQWDWALIEIMLPYTVQAQLFSYGQMRVPKLGTPGAGDVLPFPGIARTPERSLDPVDRLINTPKAISSGDHVILTSEYASFLVDLRPLQGVPAAQVDLWAYVLVAPEFRPPPIYVWAAGPGDGHGSSASPWPPLEPDMGNSGDTFPTGYTLSSWRALRPPVVWDTTAHIWHWDITGITADVAAGAFDTEWVVFSDPNYPSNEIIWGVVSSPNDYNPGYLGPSPAPSEVQVTMFNGPQAVAGQYRSDEVNYARWDFTTPDNRRLGYSVVGEPLLYTSTTGELGSPPQNLANFDNYPYLGTVTLPVEFDSNILPGPSFKPA